MPPRGMTQRSIGRLAGRHFRDEVRILKLVGVVDEIPQWEPLNSSFYNGKLIHKSGFIFSPDSANQAYDCVVLVLGTPPILDPNVRFRISLTQYKTSVETDEDDPQIKRILYLEPVSIEAKQDNIGTDVAVVMRCKTGEPPPASGAGE